MFMLSIRQRSDFVKRIPASVFCRHPFSAGQDAALQHPLCSVPISLIFRRRMQKNPRCNR